jgi:hypothetical protein
MIVSGNSSFSPEKFPALLSRDFGSKPPKHIGLTAVIRWFPRANYFLPAIPLLVDFLLIYLCVISAADIG